MEKIEDKSKPWRTKFSKGQEVYLTAFIKEEKGIFYVCKGIVESVPGSNERQVYKVRIIAVSDRAIGGTPVIQQARLLGLVCTKKVKELNVELPVFMQPSKWIDKQPKDQRYYPRRDKYNGKAKTKRQETKKKVQNR